MQFRILTNGKGYKIQQKIFFFFWSDLTRDLYTRFWSCYSDTEYYTNRTRAECAIKEKFGSRGLDNLQAPRWRPV